MSRAHWLRQPRGRPYGAEPQEASQAKPLPDLREEEGDGPAWLQTLCACAIIVIFAVTNIALWRI